MITNDYQVHAIWYSILVIPLRHVSMDTSKVFYFVIMASCSGFVAWQSYKCLAKYIEVPEGTKITFKYISGLEFPAITVCPSHYGPWTNNAVLSSCKITDDNYKEHGIWSSNESSLCQNPQKLY
jgi:hypothetical protein